VQPVALPNRLPKSLVHKNPIRKVYHQLPPMVEYSLSETGLELIPFITHLKEWGDKKIEKQKIKSKQASLLI